MEKLEHPSLANEPIVRADPRRDRGPGVGLTTTQPRRPPVVVPGIRDDGQKVLLVIKSMGGESTEAWRAVLDDLINRGLRRPEVVIVDGAPGLEHALAAVGDGALVQRCTVCSNRTSARSRPRTAARRDHRRSNHMLMQGRRRGSRALRPSWKAADEVSPGGRQLGGSRCAPVHLHALPPSQWRSARTTNAIERLHEEFKRRIKTQTVLPSADTAAMLFWALLASGQINMRKVDGWQTLATKPVDQPIDLAA